MKVRIEVTVVMDVETMPATLPRDHALLEAKRAALASVKLDTVAGVDVVTKYVSHTEVR